ncbi:phage holin family protein [Dolosicoccus paucivorans]
MQQAILSVLINALGFIVLSQISPKIYVRDFKTSLLAGTVFALLSSFLLPILTILSFPITFLTFGLFQLFLNGLIVALTDRLIDGFHVKSIWVGVLVAFILSLLQSAIFAR